LLLWFESNGSHRHLRVTLLVYWLKVACGAFSRTNAAASFSGGRKVRFSPARYVKAPRLLVHWLKVTAFSFDWPRAKGVTFAREALHARRIQQTASGVSSDAVLTPYD
jgi:hypothetical protein